MKVISWNINNVYTKLEKRNVQEMLLDYDLISLNEVKTSLPVTFPGYVTYRSKMVGSVNRGGTVLLVKNYMEKYIESLDISVVDQVWVKLHILPRVLFGFVYIPPCDSAYYSHNSFAAIQEKLNSSYNHDVVIIGDMNARFGTAVRNMLPAEDNPNVDHLSYPFISDNVNVQNDNATILSTICDDNQLVVVNNLKTRDRHFTGNKTYKRGDMWISELDLCVASLHLIDRLCDFKVVQRSDLPSDHAPVSVTISLKGEDLDSILDRASSLGDHAVLYGSAGNRKLVRKPIPVHVLDKQLFLDIIGSRSGVLNEEADVHVFASRVADVVYSAAVDSMCTADAGRNRAELGRWERLLEENDDSAVWKAINWKGEYGGPKHDDNTCPTDEEFRRHFESVLNPPEADIGDIVTITTVPILDNFITCDEVQRQINKMKPNKACGPDGISPGVLSMLPAQWIVTLVTLFNSVFLSGTYPDSWTRATLYTLFKKGDKSNPNNYRGITIINSLAKLYDMILCDRLNLWFRPFREQAGAQRKRGCLEHIVTLRLVTDTARRRKIKLFVTFIDFSKAYDLVPRKVLFNILKRLGCGTVMLAALVAMYRTTESIIGEAVMTATLGVR